MKHTEVAMRLVYASAPELNDLGAQRLVDVKIELTLAVVTMICRRDIAGLQSISPNDLSCVAFFDEQVIANRIKRVGIQPIEMGFGETFVQLEIENLKPQSLRSPYVVCGLCEPDAIIRHRDRSRHSR